MTTTADVTDPTETAADNLLRIINALAAAKADVALIERLKGAEALVASLTAEHDIAIATQQASLDDEAKAQAASRFAGFRNITVIDKTPDKSVMGSSFVIAYERLSWDMYANASLPTVHTTVGFASLPPEALDYLIERHPAQIPAKLLALAPTPRGAFERYFMGLKRGYLMQSPHDTRAGSSG